MTIKEISDCAKGKAEFPEYASEPDVLAYITLSSLIALYRGGLISKATSNEQKKLVELAHGNITTSYEWILAYCGKSMKIAEIERQARNETDADKLRQLVFDMIHIYRTLEKEATWEGE